MANDQAAGPTYKIVMQPPPGGIVAPNGFPADPYPKGAPRVFTDAMKVRIAVFCDEQKCAIEPELDEDDPKSFSWVVYECSGNASADEDVPVSTIRIVPPPHPPHPNGFHDPDECPYVKLTRVATMAAARGKGLSKRLIEEALAYLSQHPEVVGSGWNGLVLTHAQVSVERMYSRMGFTTDERLGKWNEEGIEHVGMWRNVQI